MSFRSCWRVSLFFSASSVTSIVEHRFTGWILCPIVGSVLTVGITREFNEAVVERQMVSEGVSSLKCISRSNCQRHSRSFLASFKASNSDLFLSTALSCSWGRFFVALTTRGRRPGLVDV